MGAFDSYVTQGLASALTLTDANPQKAYTPYTSTAKNAPVKTDFYQHNASAPLQQIAAPNYNLSAGTIGLMGGDYDKLQSALATKGNQQIQNAYNQGSQSLNNAMGGRGLYGSSIMAQQQIQGLDRERMNALAANEAQAAAQRYGLMQQDMAMALDRERALNSYNQAETAGQRQQSLNTFNTNTVNADSANQFNNLKYNAEKQYAEQMNNWLNQQNYEKDFLYPQAQKAWDDAQLENRINRFLSVAGQGAPLATSAANNAMQQQIMNEQIKAANQASNNQLWGSVLGGLGSFAGSKYGSGLLSDLGSKISSWWE